MVHSSKRSASRSDRVILSSAACLTSLYNSYADENLGVSLSTVSAPPFIATSCGKGSPERDRRTAVLIGLLQRLADVGQCDGPIDVDQLALLAQHVEELAKIVVRHGGLRQSMIPKSGNRFPAFAKPASAGEGRSDKIMLQQKIIRRDLRGRVNRLDRAWRGGAAFVATRIREGCHDAAGAGAYDGGRQCRRRLRSGAGGL